MTKTIYWPLVKGALPAVLVFVHIGPASAAYLDPGTGSFLLQMLMGGVAGGLVLIKLYWGIIKGWFSPRAAGRNPKPDDEERSEGA